MDGPRTDRIIKIPMGYKALGRIVVELNVTTLWERLTEISSANGPVLPSSHYRFDYLDEKKTWY